MQNNTFKYFLISSLFITLSACGGSDGNDGSTTQTSQEEAIDVIKNFAQLNGSGTTPSLSDYTDAGVDLNGVSLSEINTYISTLGSSDVDTAAEIQAIADNAGVLLVDTDGDNIPDYRDDDDDNDGTPDATEISNGSNPLVNETPVAIAGSDQQININTVVNLDASASSDVDSASLTYAWAMTNIPNGSSAAFNDATLINPTFTADIVGQYLMTLIVSDGNDSTIDTLTVTASNPASNKKIVALSTPSSGREPWVTDGTTAGTTIIQDIRAGIPDGLNIYNPVQIGNTLYFFANDGIHGKELWISDGTAVGTKMVKDITVGAGSTSVNSSAKIGSLLFFAVSSSELWKSDGTEVGTVKIGSISNGFLGDITDVDGVAFFTGRGIFSGVELWKSSGNFISKVADINTSGNSGSDSSYPSNLVNFKDLLYFTAETQDPDDPLEALIHLWGSNGESIIVGGTRSIGKASGNQIVVAGGFLYYTYYDVNDDEKLRLTNGSTSGIIDVSGSIFNDTYLEPDYLTDVDGTLFLVVETANSGSILSKVSGGSVVKVKDLIIGDSSNGNPSIDDLYAIGNRLYFTAHTPGFGTELWTSDGTGAGTVMVKDINAGDASSNPQRFTALNGNLLFEATTAGTIQYWKTDGTEAGTSVIISMGLN